MNTSLTVVNLLLRLLDFGHFGPVLCDVIIVVVVVVVGAAVHKIVEIYVFVVVDVAILRAVSHLVVSQ